MKPVLRKFVLLPGILLGALLIAGGLSQLKPDSARREVEQLDPLVEVLRLEVFTEKFRINTQGTVQPQTETIVSSEVSGSVVSISPKFVSGGVFRKNEVLLNIDPTNYQVAVDKADALVKQRQIEFDGASKLQRQGYRAEAELASAAAALAAAHAELVSARRNLERTAIRLPYDGMVLSKDVDLAQFVSPGTRLGVTFATDVAELRMPLTDRDLALVELPDARDIATSGAAQGPSVKLSAIRKGEPVEWFGTVVRTEGVVDERSRVTYAVAEIEDPYQLQGDGTPLPIGTFVAAQIDGTTVYDVIRVPRSALRGADQVLVVDDENRIDIRKVEIIHADSDYAYVTAGVAAGERIAITIIEAPINGMSVRTVELGTAAATPRGQMPLAVRTGAP